MSRHYHRRTRQKSGDYGQYYELAATLLNGPCTLAEIEDSVCDYYRLLGMFAWQLKVSPEEQTARQNYMAEGMTELLRRGWVQLQSDCYSLTETGREEVNKMLQDMHRARRLLEDLQTPETASKVSLVVYLVLALIKMPAGLLSGSVGLINDSFDTLLDGLCSLLVYLGFRFQKERLVNIFQVLMLLAAGCLTLYQSVSGFFKQYEPDVELFTFFAAILSAIACAGLYLYQRTVGLKSGSFGLITQSVDSRNHVIVAIGVTAGLIASLLKFGLLDILVGLVVSLLILKSAIEMGIELLRSLNSQANPDLSHYRITMPMIERYRRNQLCDWMLYLVQQKKAYDRSQLIAHAKQALQFKNPVLDALGIKKGTTEEEPIHAAIQHALEQGWVLLEPPLELTPAGKEHLAQQMARVPRKRHQRLMYLGR